MDEVHHFASYISMSNEELKKGPPWKWRQMTRKWQRIILFDRQLTCVYVRLCVVITFRTNYSPLQSSLLCLRTMDNGHIQHTHTPTASNPINFRLYQIIYTHTCMLIFKKNSKINIQFGHSYSYPVLTIKHPSNFNIQI